MPKDLCFVKPSSETFFGRKSITASASSAPSSSGSQIQKITLDNDDSDEELPDFNLQALTPAETPTSPKNVQLPAGQHELDGDSRH